MFDRSQVDRRAHVTDISEPDFARNSDRLAVETNFSSGSDTVGDIWIIDQTFATHSAVTNTANFHETNPSWSPDDSWIVMRRQPFNGNLQLPVGLYKLRVADGLLVKLAETGKGIGDLRYPDWQR